jgi:amino acid adenylation domain-containing protein
MEFISTLPDILKQSVLAFPEKLAVIEGDNCITYKDLDKKSNALAHYLISQGIKKGDRVGIFLDKSIEAIISFWSIIKIGAIFSFIDYRLTPHLVSYRIDNCKMKCLITSREKKETITTNSEIFSLDSNEFESIFTYFSHDDIKHVSLIDIDLAAIIFTSGSTGLPKGVVHDHRSLVSWTESIVTYLRNTEQDRILCILPFVSSYGLSQLLTSALSGAIVVLQKSMFPNDICQTLLKERITGLAGVPTIWQQLLQRYSPFKTLQFPTLRYITNAGGALSRNCLDQLIAILKDTKIYLMYGQTETLRSTYLPPEELERKRVCLGKALPNVEVFVINKDGKECEPGEEGELVHRSKMMFRGYWNDPEKTSRVIKLLPFRSGEGCNYSMAVWTGDIVKKDEEGFLYFVGRDDELMKCFGYRVSPQEIEDVLYKVDKINEVVVFGQRDEIAGHKIKAVVSLTKETTELSEKEILDFCKKELPDYMWPQGIEILDELPKTATGKIDRARIKEDYGNA